MGNHRDPKIEAMFKTCHKLADRGECEEAARSRIAASKNRANERARERSNSQSNSDKKKK